MAVMTEATPSCLEFLVLELSKPPVPGKLGWPSPVVLSASCFRMCLVWKTALENTGLLVQWRRWTFFFLPEVCPFLNLVLQSFTWILMGKISSTGKFPGDFFPQAWAEKDPVLSMSSVVSAGCKPQGLSGMSDHGQWEAAICVWSPQFTHKCFSKKKNPTQQTNTKNFL